MKENVRISTLPNGLRIATDAIENVATTSLGIWTSCGARHEPEDVNGVAHMLEHMLFKGTPSRNAQAIAEEMEAVGGQMNAYTGRENTAYYARVMAGDTPLLLDMLADILQHSLFDETELAREQQVVLQELGQALDTPDDIIYDYFHEAAYPGQAAGRSILGSEESVSGLTQGALKQYIASEYAPSRLVVTAAGAIDHDWLVGEAERCFVQLPSERAQAVRPACYEGGDLRVIDDLEQVHLILGFPGCGLHDPNYYALQVYTMALGGGMSSRLFQEVREKRGLAYSISSFTSDLEDGGVLGIYAGTSAESLDELMPVLCEQLVAATHFQPEEIARAKAQMKVSLLMGLESSFSRAEALALNVLAYGRHVPVAEVLAKIEAVDAVALQRVGQRVRMGAPTVTAMGDVGKLMPYPEIARLCAR